MLHIFHNNTSTDFRTANKHIFISSCYSSDLAEPKYHKTKLNKTGQDQHLKLSPQSHLLFYIVFFDKKRTPEVNICGCNSLSPLRFAFFSDPSFSKCGTESCLSSRKGTADTVSDTK